MEPECPLKCPFMQGKPCDEQCALYMSPTVLKDNEYEDDEKGIGCAILQIALELHSSNEE
jgi:hypothetical protein